jgi:transcriptional regulator with XRE-family HTH domain
MSTGEAYFLRLNRGKICMSKQADKADAGRMTASQFRAWRKALGLKQKEAAELLGLKKRMIQYYETGSRNGNDVRIPKTVRLACYALQAGVHDFDGVIALGPDEEALPVAVASDTPPSAETAAAAGDGAAPDAGDEAGTN